MKPGKKAGVHRALLTMLVLLVAGCSYTVKFDARLPVAPAVDQIPLHVGVYYSPEFVEYTKKAELIGCGPNGRRDRWGIFYVFPVGTVSRDLFDQIVASMFATVTKTSGPPQSLNGAPSIDGLLEPRIESFDWDTVCSAEYFSSGKFMAKVRYVINLYDSLDGHLVASMPAEGQHTENPRLSKLSLDWNYGAKGAIQDAMAKFILDFYDRSEVKAWVSTRMSGSQQ